MDDWNSRLNYDPTKEDLPMIFKREGSKMNSYMKTPTPMGFKGRSYRLARKTPA